MKPLCCVFVIFVVMLTVASAEWSPEDYEKFAKNCQKETKASDKDVEELINLSVFVPTTKAAKCLHACFFQTIGLVDKTNKLVPEALATVFIGAAKKDVTDDGKSLKEIAKAIGQKCNPLSLPDKCESIVKVKNCLRAETEKLAI